MMSPSAVRTSFLVTVLCASMVLGGLAATRDGGPPPDDAAVQSESPGPPLPPLELAKVTTEQVFSILRDPELKGDENAAKRHKLVRKVVDKRFDWLEMAKRALGRHWKDRTAEEQAEFTKLFSDLIEDTYLSTIERNLDAKISYEGQQLEDKYAMVKTLAVTRRETEVPIAYRLRKVEIKPEKEGEKPRTDWLVYDVRIEGVSMVNNYRAQFNDIIVGSSYKKLVERLKAKLAQTRKAFGEEDAVAEPAAEPAEDDGGKDTP
jgi:phospholipid transport system substrate-binding protein